MSAPPEPSRTDRALLRGRAVRAALGSVLVAGAMGWALHKGALPVVPEGDVRSLVSVSGLVGFALLFVLSSMIRAAKWWWLLAPVERVELKRVIWVSLVGYAALFIFPFRMGEFVRPMMIRRAGISGWAAVGTVGAERVIDGLTVTLLLALGLLTT